MHTRRRKYASSSDEFLNRPRLRRVLGIRPLPETSKTGLAPEADATDESMKEARQEAYVRMNVREYLARTYPEYCLKENADLLDERGRLIRNLLFTFFNLRDALCYYYPDMYKPECNDVAFIDKILDSTMLYNEGVKDAVITPPPWFTPMAV